jgi:hypothetical protein
MSVDELLGWIAGRGHTGILTIKRGPVAKTLNIESGGVVNAASTDPREYFGQFLINFGLITEDQLQKAFETQQETRVLLGKILVMTGLVTEDQVLKMLELKIRETVLDTYLWSQGAFEFQDGLLNDDPSEVHVAVELAKLSREGLSRRDRTQRIRQVIADNRCTFEAKTGDQIVDPRGSAKVILDLAKQGFSAADIILRLHSLDYPILSNLYDLVQRGLLTVKPPSAGSQQDLPVIEVDLSDMLEDSTLGPDQYLLEAQGAMQRRDFEQSLAILRKGLGEHPYDPDLTDAQELAERGLVEQLRAELLTDNKIPTLVEQDAALMSDRWTPAQRYILSRIDGKRRLRSIIMVSPLKEVDALRTVLALIRAKVVGMK